MYRATSSQPGWAGARNSGPRTRISSHHPPALMRGELTPSISRHAAIRAHRNCGTADRSWIPPAAHARQARPLSGIILMTTRANTIGSNFLEPCLSIYKFSAHTWQPCSPFSTPLIQSPPNLPLQYSVFPCVRDTSLTRQRVTTPAPSPPSYTPAIWDCSHVTPGGNIPPVLPLRFRADKTGPGRGSCGAGS